MIDTTTNAYKSLIEAPKSIVFYTDTYSRHNLEKNQDTSLSFINLDTYDSLRNAYNQHQIQHTDLRVHAHGVHIRTSIISGLSLDWQKEGFKVFLMRNASLLEVKPGEIKECGFILTEYQDILELFLHNLSKKAPCFS